MTAIKGTDEGENHDVYLAHSDRRYLIITMGIITAAYLISMSTDCLGVVLELNGILAAVPLAYVLPALCYLKLEEGNLLCSKKLPALGLLVAGILAAISGLLLVIFNNDTAESCLHGKIMSYCINNSTLEPTTTITSLQKKSTTTIMSILTKLIDAPETTTPNIMDYSTSFTNNRQIIT